jgi:eukaryotic-like serine/threonine-protein kinase
MTTANNCPQCGNELSSNASPEGLCPRCLLAFAAEGYTEQTGNNSIETASAQAMVEKESLIGQILDEKYRLDKVLGRGGMGKVYQATHLGTERLVAVKVIAPELMSNDMFVKRFKREAKTAGSLRHPNVVNVTDFGTANVGSEQIAYLVMEYLDGCSLGDMLREKGRLSLEFAVDILEQICSAVDEAHKHGIIHRDLKPENIWLEQNERGGYNVKVLDFGLAKIYDSAPSNLTYRKAIQPSTSRDFSEAVTKLQFVKITDEEKRCVSVESKTDQARDLQVADANGPTVAGMVIGTPLYMSPEQCRGMKLDMRSDIYSLGVIAYEVISGETPFTGDVRSIIKQHIEASPPPLKEKCPEVPESVAALVMSALVKNPQSRLSSAAAFANALRVRAESTGSVIRQAIALCNDHFFILLRVSLLGNIPALIVSIIGLLSVVLITLKVLPPLAWAITNLFVLMFLVTSIFLIPVINAGQIGPITAHFLVTPLLPVKIYPVFNKFKKRLRPLMTTKLRYHSSEISKPLPFTQTIFIVIGLAIGAAIKAWLEFESVFFAILFFLIFSSVILIFFFIQGLKASTYKEEASSKKFPFWLFASVVMMEGLEGQAALNRSNVLSTRLPRAAKTSLFCIYFIWVTSILLIFSFTGLFIDQFLPELKLPPFHLFFIGSPFIVLFNIFFNPLIGVLHTLNYFKVRQAGGETPKEILQQYKNLI